MTDKTCAPYCDGPCSPTCAQRRQTVEQVVVAEVLTRMRLALERLPAEREAIKTAPMRERQYRMGLCDGMEETIANLCASFAPLSAAASGAIR